MNERDAAFEILQRVDRDADYLDSALQKLHLPDGTRGAARTLAFGVTRWRSLLDHWIEAFAERKLKKIDDAVVSILRIGLYDLYFNHTPPHAAVSETVSLASRRAARAKGFVNALMRRASTADLAAMIPTGVSAREIAIANGHDAARIERWIAEFGIEKTRAIAAADQEHSYPDLVVNTTRISPEDVAALLRERGIAFSASPFLDFVFRLRTSTSPVADLMANGLVYAMDEGSAIIATLPSNDEVLDLTAAPGGKSVVMRMRGAKVVSHDVSLRRIGLLRENWPALFSERPNLVIGDGRQPPFRKRFATVLLDAPCSATGTMRKNPEVKWRVDEACIAGFAALQKGLLSSALDVCDDECIYATCSLEAEENDRVVDEVLSKRDDFERADLTPRVPSSLADRVDGWVFRLTPDAGTDGFIATRLRRR